MPVETVRLHRDFLMILSHAHSRSHGPIQRDAGLRSAGLKITSEGEIPAEEIDRRQLIDKHYYAIASKATLLKPDQLNVPEAQFEKQFGEKTNNWLLARVVVYIYCDSECIELFSVM